MNAQFPEPFDLGCRSNREVLQSLLDLEGKRVADIGCGGLTFSQILLELGATVIGVDPDPVQAQLNRETELPAGLSFIEAASHCIPFEDHSLDGVCFSYSLHHIPADHYPETFREVLRVLRPGGFLYVIEPMDCPFNRVMKLFHDEDQERYEARRALEALVTDSFEQILRLQYHQWVQYDSFEEFAERFSSRTFNPGYTEADVRHPNVAVTFEREGGSDHRFQSPKWAVCARTASAS